MGADEIEPDANEASAISSLARFPDENPNPILRASEDGILRYANAGAKPLLKHWGVSPGRRLPISESITLSVKTKKLVSVEVQTDDATYAITIAPIPDVPYVNLYGRDVTEEKRKTREVSDLARFPDENPNPVFRVSTEGVLLYGNAGASTLFEFWGVGVGDRAPRVLLEPLMKKPAQIRMLEVDVEGRLFALELAPVLDAGYWNGYGRDVTAQRRAEQELIKARDAALAANRAKSSFLANMSHELRTPMNAIIGYSEMLAEELEEEGRDAFVKDLEKIHGAGRHLLGLINDMLDLSKIEAGGMDLYFEEFSVTNLLKDVLETLRPIVDKKRNTLVLDASDEIPRVHSDITKTRQILFNLLSNANKFTDAGTITVRVTHDADALRVDVIDTGIGMTPEQANRIFDAFTQADASTTKRYGGTGLGLTIAQRFAEMMGGDIWVTSEVGVGTTFTFKLPLRASLTLRPPTSEPREQSVDPLMPTVLVIDDDVAVREIVGSTLKKSGFGVVTAQDGVEGLRLAKELRPLAITLDVVMHGMDGWQVLTQLKSDPDTRDIPVVLVTVEDDRSLGFALGAAEFMTKPIDREHLVSLMHRYAREGQAGSVLVVEDEDDTRELVQRTLVKAGWATAIATNGREALEHLAQRTSPPDIILLDLMMPVMDGFQFLEALRSNPETRAIPVVVTTAKTLTANEREFLTGSVQELLQKGAFSAAALLERLRALDA